MGKKYSIGAKYPDGKKTKCKWKGCKPNTHPFRVTYIKGGILKRGSYVGTWDRSNGQKYPKKFKGNKIKLKSNPSIKLTYANFWFQKHHVIPVSVMKNLSNISANLELLGWNMNDGDVNGICLPFNYEAIRFYNLQAHRGSHPNYSRIVKSELNELESDCLEYCKSDEQDYLISDIEDMAQDFISRIVDWSLIIHTESLKYFQ